MSAGSTCSGTFGALLARDIRVLRRNVGQFLIRTIMQPLLFVFVFAYVFPKIGQGFRGVAQRRLVLDRPRARPDRGRRSTSRAIQAVALPLVQEFSVSKEIEDRVLAPVPVWVVGLEKIVAGAHAGDHRRRSSCSRSSTSCTRPARRRRVHVHDWPLFAFALVFASFLAAVARPASSARCSTRAS